MQAEFNGTTPPKNPTKLSSSRDLPQQHWHNLNRKAVAEYNRRIEANGCFSDRLRRF